MKRKSIIVDLDGTLANIDHRLHFIRTAGKKDYDSFFAACAKDSPNMWCYELVHAMFDRGFEIHIVTARPDEYITQTVEWLVERAGLPASASGIALHMVRTKETRFAKDVDLKRAWLKSNPALAKQILFVVEDRKRVADMWRAEGYTVLHCDDWQEAA